MAETFLDQLVQQAGTPLMRGYGVGQVTPGEMTAMSGIPATGTPMNRAAAIGQVTPGEIVDDMYRQAGRMTPEMGLTRPTAASTRLAIGSGSGGGGLAIPAGNNVATPGGGGLAIPGGTTAAGPGGTGVAIPAGPRALGPGSAAARTSIPAQVTMAPRSGLNPSIPTPGAPTTVIPGGTTAAGPVGSTGAGAGSTGKVVSATGQDLTKYTLSEADFALSQEGSFNTAGKLGAINTKLNSLLPGGMAVNMTVGSLMSGLGVASTGLMASGWIDSKDFGGENSNFDRGISGGLKGAALFGGGAIALGLSSGPVGWAALAGAALFGLGEAFLWGEDKSTQEQMQDAINGTNATIDSLINNPQFGIDTDTAQQIRLQVAATTQFFLQSEDKEGLDLYLKSLATTVPSFLMQASEQNKINQQRMRLQAAYGPVYASMMEQSAQANQQTFATQMQAANQIADPNIRTALQSQAAESYKASQQLNAAYAQQVAGATTQLPAAAQSVQDQVAAMQQQYLQPVP